MKLLKNQAGKKIRLASLATLSFLLFSATAFSQQPATQDNAGAMQVKYLAADNEAMFFNLKYNNDSGNKFKLMVLNGTGEVLFQNDYSGKKLRKRIRLARLTDTDDVTFLIKPAKEDIQLTCKVKVKSKVVDEPATTDED